ncbi:hypothetical protein L1987_50541 [Smallanthus sonchifolius]|uniref:Uncharacterized protein n=1 Tax=Smallanthus sonchifolius TaxID=185202 RepID=A0ACB9EN55_9ASTR|nr:hypothetical protein L1987_50541 [Smallanthus sonchifolius]
MHKQSISVVKAAAILASLVVLLTMVEPCNASLSLTLLESLDHSPGHSPGNGCSETGTGGNPCKPPVNAKAFAGRNWATATTPSPPPPPSLLFSVETATNRKLMMGSHGA